MILSTSKFVIFSIFGFVVGILSISVQYFVHFLSFGRFLDPLDSILLFLKNIVSPYEFIVSPFFSILNFF